MNAQFIINQSTKQNWCCVNILKFWSSKFHTSVEAALHVPLTRHLMNRLLLERKLSDNLLGWRSKTY